MSNYRDQMFRNLTGGRHAPSAYSDVTDQDGDGGLQDALSLLKDGARMANGDTEGDDDTRDPFTDLGSIGTAARRIFANHRAAGEPMTVNAKSAEIAKFILAVHKQARPGEAA